MALLLYRLGRFSARRRWFVLGAWTLVLVVLGFGAFGIKTDVTQDASFSIPGTQSSRGLDVLADKFGGYGRAVTATVAFQAPPGETLTGANADLVRQAIATLGDIDGVTSASDPLDEKTGQLSPDKRVAASTVTFTEPLAKISEATQQAFHDATGRDAGPVRVEVVSQLPEEAAGAASEVIGVAIAFVVLLFTYLSLAAAGANLLTAFLSVGPGLLGILALGNFVSLSSTTPLLALMLGLAVGIDYALFIFARARTELRAGATVPDAIAKATGTAGSAVIFAGLTVIIALCGLVLVDIPFLTQLGLGAAGTVLIAVLVAVTAVPAALSLLGRRLLPRRERRAEPATSEDKAGVDKAGESKAGVGEAGEDKAGENGAGVLGRWARGVTGRPVLALLLAVLCLGAASVPFFSMRTALPSAQNGDPESSSRQAYDLLTEAFGPGSQSTLLAIVESTGGTTPVAETAAGVAEKIKGLGGVVMVAPPVPAPDGSAALLPIIPGSGPTDEATSRLVLDIRAATGDIPGAEVLVTGDTALSIDVTAALRDALPVYLIVIVGLALILLLIMFRSLAVPVMATLGFLLSLGTGLGISTAIFQWGWLAGVFGVAQPGPLLSFMPILVVGILFGLATDYQVFLVSAIHERHSAGMDPKLAVLAGFRQSGPVVVAAAIIMAGVFGGFAFSGDATIGPIGMALMIGVLADALVVRMVIMPAALTLLGSKAWWMPRGLNRVVPNIDVEGRALDEPAPVHDSPLVASR